MSPNLSFGCVWCPHVIVASLSRDAQTHWIRISRMGTTHRASRTLDESVVVISQRVMKKWPADYYRCFFLKLLRGIQSFCCWSFRPTVSSEPARFTSDPVTRIKKALEEICIFDGLVYFSLCSFHRMINSKLRLFPNHSTVPHHLNVILLPSHQRCGR